MRYTNNSNDKTTLINESQTNAEAIANTYYEYHGKMDDGNSPADDIPYGYSEVSL